MHQYSAKLQLLEPFNNFWEHSYTLEDKLELTTCIYVIYVYVIVIVLQSFPMVTTEYTVKINITINKLINLFLKYFEAFLNAKNS